jgi:hypothetical protein
MRQGTEEVRNETEDGRHGTEEGVIWGTEDRRKRERKPRGRNKTKKTFRYRSFGVKRKEIVAIQCQEIVINIETEHFGSLKGKFGIKRNFSTGLKKLNLK